MTNESKTLRDRLSTSITRAATRLPADTRVRFIPALRAPWPAYTITGEAVPFTNIRPTCPTHPGGCPGPWYALADQHGQPLEGVYCGGELETLQ